MDKHSDNIFSVKFHPGGTYFASASGDKTIRLWDFKTGEVIKTIPADTRETLRAKVKKVHEHQDILKKMDFFERANLLSKYATKLLAKADLYGKANTINCEISQEIVNGDNYFSDFMVSKVDFKNRNESIFSSIATKSEKLRY